MEEKIHLPDIDSKQFQKKGIMLSEQLLMLQYKEQLQTL